MNKRLLKTMLCAATLLSCGTKNSEEIILRIGQYQLPAARLDAKLKSEKYKHLTGKALQDKLVDDGRIIAFALDQQYDTISALNKLLEYALRTYASRVEGFVWNRRVKPKLQLSEANIRDSLRKKYMAENSTRIFKEAKPRMYSLAIDELTAKFDAATKSWPGVKPGQLLMEYTFGGKRVPFLVSDFQEFVNNEPVFLGSLAQSQDVEKMLRSFIIEQYLWAEARQMNIETHPEFLQFKKNYQENIFIEQYKRNFLYPRLSIPTEALKEYYLNNSHHFKTFGSATVAIYTFKDIREAMQGRKLLSTGTMQLPGPMPVEIKMNDLHNDPKLIAALLHLNTGQISPPVAINRDYVVISLIAKKGETTLPYLYAQEQIKQVMYAEKEKQVSTQLAEDLKAKYPVKTDRIREHLAN